MIKMGSVTFVRRATLLLNLLILLGGLTLVGTGTWISVNSSAFLQLLGPFNSQVMQYINAGFYSIATGALLVLLGLLGFCGARKESKCLLLMFFSIILIVFIAEVATAAVVLAYSSFAEWILRAWATPVLQKDYGSDPAITHIWKTTMTELRCCGFNNYTDFVASKFEKETEGNLPPSCCRTNGTTCGRAEARRSDVQGCSKDVLKTIRYDANIVGSVAAGVGMLEIAAMSLSIYLYFHLDDDGHGHEIS